MRAMVLAAGLGTRLRPLTLERPKPVVPYGQRPLACVALETLAGLGVRRVVMNTHHLGEQVPELLVGHVPAGMVVDYVHEPTLLGTGGGLRNVWPALDDGEPVLVMNADIVFHPDLEGALALHRSLGAMATMVLRPDPEATRFGTVEVDADSRVRRLLGEPAFPEPLRTMMFTGVHVLSPRAFEDLPHEGCIVRHAYRRWVDDPSVTVAGFVETSPWEDLGTHRRYLDACLRLAPDVHPAASIDPAARLEHCVVGEGARVGPVRLRRCVVWPGARVENDLQEAIVTRQYVVPVG